PAAPVRHPAKAAPVPAGSRLELYPALAVFGVSGFCGMAYEVLWTRLMGLLIAPTIYSFTIIVFSFIIGLALGSLVFGWWGDRTRRPLDLLIATQVLAAFFALGVSQFLGQSQFFFAKLIYELKDDFPRLMAAQTFIIFAVLLGPTLMLGAAFPLVNKIYARSLPAVGRSIGTAYAVNTLGAILGSFTAGFLLLPFLGKESGLTLVIALQLGAALAARAATAVRKPMAGRRWAALAAAGVIGAALLVYYPSWDRRLLSYGRYQNFPLIEKDLAGSSWPAALVRGPRLLAKYETGREVLYYGDGVAGFTTVEKAVDSIGRVEYTLINSGKPDASARGDTSTQGLLAHAPLLFHPRPRRVMVLGLGGGMTAGEALLYPLEHLDVLEINERVVEASRFFKPWNNDFLTDPRTRVIVQDGRNHLALTLEKYDVIISEPSNPWMAGLANLYTLEFFETVRERLNEGGIFVQWIHSYGMDWPTLALVGRTFHAAFPHGLMMASLVGAGDYLLLGFNGGPGPDLATAQKNMEYLRRSKVLTLPDPRLLFHLIVSEDLGALFGAGPLHTDNRPRLEFAAPRSLHRQDATIAAEIEARRKLDSRTEEILASSRGVDSSLDLAAFSASVYARFFPAVDLAGATAEQKGRYRRIVEDYCGLVPVTQYDQFTDDQARLACARTQVRLMEDHLAEHPEDARAWLDLGLAQAGAGDLEAALKAWEKGLAADPSNAAAQYNIGHVLLRRGRPDQARDSFQKALAQNPAYAAAWFSLAQVNLSLGRKAEAVKNLKA
ncbi:MAG: fused MFS/spermidine synthase, partial [Thermodesulfobacteriota bacterium]